MPDPQLKIALVALDFNQTGGSERRTGQLLSRLLRQGHEVHLVGARIDGPVDARVVCHRIPTMARPHWLDLWQFARRAERLVPGLDCDVVHNQIRPFVPGVLTVGGGCHRFYLSEVLPRERGAVRAWAKRQAPLHRLLLALERRGLTPARCPVVLTNSALARAGILKYYDYPGDRIVVAHNGVDAERFRPAASPESREAVRRRLSVGPGEILVLFVGSGFARKGLGALLEAVARIEAAGSAYRVAVVGGGSSGAWRRRAERLGVADRVRFVGAVPDPETYYRAADIFALPTHFDPFANATLEAMASALPVVTTRENGVAELIRPGRDGLVIEHPEAVDDLARALGALRDPDARRAMGAEARRTALRHPWDAPLEAALRAYQRAAAERAASPAESQ